MNEWMIVNNNNHNNSNNHSDPLWCLLSCELEAGRPAMSLERVQSKSYLLRKGYDLSAAPRSSRLVDHVAEGTGSMW